VDRTLKLLLTVMGALSLGAGAAWSQETRTVYAPIRMPFNAETGVLKTTACLQLTERVYPQTRWWEDAAATAPEPDRAFKSVIAAMKQKDRAALLKLTSPAQARNTGEFDKQASAFFRQLQWLQLLAVPYAYEFDGLVVFFAKFQSERQTAFVPLTFAYEADGTFGFLPSRTNTTTFSLVGDWFAPSGSAAADTRASDTPAYCKDSDVKRATHRVSLVSSRWRPSSLLLSGAPPDAPGPLSAITAQVKSTIDRMKAAFRGPDVDEFFKYMTPQGGSHLKQWFATASQIERDSNKTAFIGQQPFFVFDESPLVVVYTRTQAREIRVLYFAVAADKRLLWGNASYISGLVDRVYERGPLFAAASSTRPFSGLAIK
jgi:hypothetical protein